MIKITEIRILPPIAIGRLGASEIPLQAYDLKISEEKPLDFRKIVPTETFIIDKDSGSISGEVPENIIFKDVSSLHDKSGKIRPVAPFLEVFAITDKHSDELVPLTTELLEQAGLSLENLHWNVEVGNIKIFRRTKDKNDKIIANLKNIKDHKLHKLSGECNNFLSDKTLPLGTIQFIAPSKEYPGIRLRFTPAAGRVYGSSLINLGTNQPDTIINNEDLVLYDINKGSWRGYSEGASFNPTYTNPAQIYAGFSTPDNNQVSLGYLDDECDGFVSVNLKISEEEILSARAHIGAGPPAFAPDTLPIRVISDELEQIILGPDADEEVSIEEAEDLVRRAFETIRLMNTAIMNGNPFEGRLNVASTMVRQDTNDFGRYYEPIMATSIVDNLALLTLHERVFNSLGSYAAPWFSEVLRRPDEIGNLSSDYRRKMPALMRGADGRMLCLTRLQVSKVIKAAASALFSDSNIESNKISDDKLPLKANNLTAQMHYKGDGNPFSVLPRSAISNCFPGLEFDFRNLWRRAFQGIVLIENNNYVLETDEKYKGLLNCRLVAIEGNPTMVATQGPTFPNGDNIPLKTVNNPNGVSFMEWSNSMVQVLQKQGQEVICHFTKEPSHNEIVVTKADLDNKDKFQQVSLRVNYIFEGNSAAFSKEILQPGELTQGLCAPWQNDYRECACYYWAASRPDYVNVEPDENGLSKGDNWMAKKRTGEYIPDDRTNSRLLSYDDLFENWQGELNFIIKGVDAFETEKDKK